MAPRVSGGPLGCLKVTYALIARTRWLEDGETAYSSIEKMLGVIVPVHAGSSRIPDSASHSDSCKQVRRGLQDAVDVHHLE